MVRNYGEAQVNGTPLEATCRLTLLMHKPAGYVVSRDDPLNRDTVVWFIDDTDTFVRGLLPRYSNCCLTPAYTSEHLVVLIRIPPVEHWLSSSYSSSCSLYSE